MAGEKLLSVKMETRYLMNDIKKHLRDVAPAAHRKAVRELFFRLLYKVIVKTPKDTGRAQGGWGAGMEALGIEVPQGEGYAEGRALSEFKESGNGVRYRIVVVNKVEYIEALESGHSTQAPFGMVRISLREIEQWLGGRKIPPGIQAIYDEAWAESGLAAGTELRAGVIRDAIGLGAEVD